VGSGYGRESERTHEILDTSIDSEEQNAARLLADNGKLAEAITYLVGVQESSSVDRVVELVMESYVKQGKFYISLQEIDVRCLTNALTV
jgi:hypothetical protein